MPKAAHFTSQADIAKVVLSTIVTPWRERRPAAGSIADLERVLGDMYPHRVLDPACGSGNFLYFAYREMRRLEHEAMTLLSERRRKRAGGVQAGFAYVTPDHHFYGLDGNPFAVEVAR
jgi:type I restriction-modification system DNA methylase subunit